MNINIISPFSLNKKFGTELNRCIENIPSEDWICVMDLDAMFLSHKQIPMLYDYIKKYPDAGLFIAKSNRSGTPHQRFNGAKSENSDLKHWIKTAEGINHTLSVSIPQGNRISGFLMLFSKQTWLQNKFSDELNILHVDRVFAQGVLDLGKKILIMNDVLIWHSYRLLNGTQDKKHLL